MRQILAGLALAVLLSAPVLAQTPAPDSQLCRAQLELLVSGDKLTEAEEAVFEAQCTCLETQEQGGDADDRKTCAQT